MQQCHSNRAGQSPVSEKYSKPWVWNFWRDKVRECRETFLSVHDVRYSHLHRHSVSVM